jgi:hydroxyethylthiazole kinase-like uncharacterized protein yjeF
MHDPVHWTARDAADMIARPSATDDKYTRGVLGVATGSERYPGAAVLGVSAALATGVGMVRYLGHDRPTALVLAACPEAVVEAGRVQAWLAGSGMDEAAADAPDLQHHVAEGLPTVLDAGALSLARRATAPTVITPHARELARLLDVDPGEVTADPQRAAAGAAASLGVVVLLKGSSTVVASPDGALIACDPATPWLATAGTGDVLAGILGALVATHAADLESGDERMLARLAASASVIHAAAASRASAGGPFTVSALVEAIPATVAGLLA